MKSITNLAGKGGLGALPLRMFLLACLLAGSTAAADGGPKADHGPWERILTAYVIAAPSGVNLFDYGSVTQDDSAALDGYIASLSRFPVSQAARREQLAFWINLYNALTVRVVLDHYPVDSIRDIDISGVFVDGPWKKALVTVEGKELSLDDIEHGILRPEWRDPLIHYGVNCAAISCPNLSGHAYTGAAVRRQLTQAARDYVNSRRGVRVRGGQLEVSSIYVWYATDFGADDMEIIDHLRAYAAPELARELVGIARIAGDDYDWSLNDTSWDASGDRKPTGQTNPN